MLLTERKRRSAAAREMLDTLEDYLPVWRFCEERCVDCQHTQEVLIPWDIMETMTEFECLACRKMRAIVVGVVVDYPAASLREAKRMRALLEGRGEWEATFERRAMIRVIEGQRKT
jgi:hypothetical protein